MRAGYLRGEDPHDAAEHLEVRDRRRLHPSHHQQTTSPRRTHAPSERPTRLPQRPLPA